VLPVDIPGGGLDDPHLHRRRGQQRDGCDRSGRTDAVFDLRDVVANGNRPTDDQSTTKLLDSMLGKGFTLGDRAKQKAGVLSGDFGMYIVAFVCYLGTAALMLFAAVLLMIAKIAMAVLLVVGPVFILLLMFNSTKRYFSMWLGQTL